MMSVEWPAGKRQKIFHKVCHPKDSGVGLFPSEFHNPRYMRNPVTARNASEEDLARHSAASGARAFNREKGTP